MEPLFQCLKINLSPFAVFGRHEKKAMKKSALARFIFLSSACFGAEQKIVEDINCDSKPDSAEIMKTENTVTLKVTLNDGTEANELSFGLGQPDRQDALCGVDPILKREKLADDLSDALGQNPPGYKASPNCFGLNISAGDCDSIHVYWNHQTKMLNGWRL